MPTYISLMKLTQQGVQSIKEGPARLEAAKQGIKAMGGEVKGFYLTMGQYDLVLIFEAPNDEAVARSIIASSMQGNVSTQTMRAFNEAEYKQVIASLP